MESLLVKKELDMIHVKQATFLFTQSLDVWEE